MRAAEARGIQSRMLREQDIATIFLGHQKGAFSELAETLPKKDAETFKSFDFDDFREWLIGLEQTGELWVTLAKSQSFEKRDRVPIGLWFVHLWMPHLVMPHVTWMPWATSRQKLEGMLAFFVQQRVSRELGVFGETRYGNFWRRLAQYGVFARVGTWPHYFPNGDDAEVWRVI